MMTPAEAERAVLGAMRSWPREDCPLGQAHGRVLRAELRADRDLPPFDRVTLDGYAVRSAAVASGLRRFRVQAVQAAGVRAVPLEPAADACVEVMTGAVLPPGADCIVPYEETRREGDWVDLEKPPAAGQAIHRRGSDHRAGDRVIPAGTRLTGREIAVAAACGYASLTVTRSPRIALVASGDELVEVGSPVAAHQIRRSNDYALRAALAAAGYPRSERFHVRDLREEVEHLLWHLIAEYDVVVVIGGISKGKFDFLPSELIRQGVEKRVQSVAQRPGKPFWFGLSRRETAVFGLPGNPVSSYTCLHRFVLPALDQASGLAPSERPIVTLTGSCRTGGRLAVHLPVRLSSGPAAELRAEPIPSNTSGDFAGLIGTDGFVELPAGTEEFAAGYCGRFFRWY